MLGDYASSCGSWSLYSATGNIPMALSEAIIATYMTIHMARSPVHTVRELRLLPGVAGGSFRAFWHHPPPPQKLPIAPIFIADSVSLAVSREQDGKLQIVYAGWDDANVVQPDGYRQSRGGREAVLTPLPRGSADPLKN